MLYHNLIIAICALHVSADASKDTLSNFILNYSCFKLNKLLQCIHTGECQSPLGVVDTNLISNDKMSASSQTDEHPAEDGRLYGDTAWRPNNVNGAYSAVGESIQVTFDKPMNVTAIGTQGRNSDDGGGNEDEWVTQYKVQYSNDGSQWMYITDNMNNNKVSILSKGGEGEILTPP